MTYENAKVLHKHFKDIKRLDCAKQLETRYPELAPQTKKVEKPVDEVKKDGEVRKR